MKVCKHCGFIGDSNEFYKLKERTSTTINGVSMPISKFNIECPKCKAIDTIEVTEYKITPRNILTPGKDITEAFPISKSIRKKL